MESKSTWRYLSRKKKKERDLPLHVPFSLLLLTPHVPALFVFLSFYHFGSLFSCKPLITELGATHHISNHCPLLIHHCDMYTYPHTQRERVEVAFRSTKALPWLVVNCVCLMIGILPLNLWMMTRTPSLALTCIASHMWDPALVELYCSHYYHLTNKSPVGGFAQ